MEKVIRKLLDDIDAAEGREVEATERLLIGLDGSWREIDLSAKNAAKLQDTLQPWWQHARPASIKKAPPKPAPSPKHTGSGLSSEQLKAVREWARKNGWATLSDRGRVPADAIAAFEAAGGVAPEFSNKELPPL